MFVRIHIHMYVFMIKITGFAKSRLFSRTMVCMYVVCMYVCIYACMFVCLNVCMYSHSNVRTYDQNH